MASVDSFSREGTGDGGRGTGPAALEHLQRLAGPGTAFREGQLEAIEQLVDQRRRVLCVQRTGWGKSAVYFVATALLRERGSGPTLLVSPLLALMRNQVLAAEALGLRARTINSSNRDEWTPIEQELARDEVDLLMISPERLNNPGFRRDVLPDFIDRVGLLVVDEAHCISDWGHDFRPDYRRIAKLLPQLSPDVAVLCTTATANDRVVADVEAQLQTDAGGLLTIRGTLDRPALRLEVVDLPGSAERLAWLATHIPTLPGSGIVYCLTIRDVDVVCDYLRTQGIAAEPYSGDSDPESRPGVETRLLANEVKAVVATSALGMGYDKPDLGFVVHYQAPGSPIAYYQQVGRAGRKLDQAHAVLLRGVEDRQIQDYFIQVAFPPEQRVREVLDALGASDEPLSMPAIEQQVNIRRGRLEAMLKVLEVEDAVDRTGAKWSLTATDWSYDADRVERVTAERRAEQRAMEDYAKGEVCLMQFLRAAARRPAGGAVRPLRRLHRAPVRRPAAARARPRGRRVRPRPPRHLPAAQALDGRARAATSRRSTCTNRAAACRTRTTPAGAGASWPSAKRAPTTTSWPPRWPTWRPSGRPAPAG